MPNGADQLCPPAIARWAGPAEWSASADGRRTGKLSGSLCWWSG